MFGRRTLLDAIVAIQSGDAVGFGQMTRGESALDVGRAGESRHSDDIANSVDVRLSRLKMFVHLQLTAMIGWTSNKGTLYFIDKYNVPF